MLRRSTGVAILLALMTLAPSAALASDPSHMVVTGGGLGISPQPAVSDFVMVALDGTARSTTSHMDPFVVTDARGSGAGWGVTIQASTFREWDGTAYISGGGSLPTGSLAMTSVLVAAEGTDSPPPLVAEGPYIIDGATVVLATAPGGTGMGSYGFTPGSLVLTVPAGAYAATYRSEIAISITSSP